MTRRLLVCTAMLLLGGCLMVDDFAGSFKKARPDACISTLAKGLYLTEFQRDPGDKKLGDLARVLDVGSHRFLLLKQEPNDRGGRLYRVTFVHGIFQRWRLSPVMREAFERDYPHTPVKLERDTVTLPVLDAATLALLTEIAAKPEYWEIEEQTLYNPLRDPQCRYDDRLPEKVEQKMLQKRFMPPRKATP